MINSKSSSNPVSPKARFPFRDRPATPLQKERIPLSLSPESKQNRLDELYEYSKSKGTITYKEIMDRLSGLDLDADQLDHVLDTLEAYGVSVVNDNADRQVTLTEEQAADQAAEVARLEGETPNLRLKSLEN